MSRYSRNFGTTKVKPERLHNTPGYSRYRAKPEAVPCLLCDGYGAYAGADGPVDCDLCEGSGVVAAEEQNAMLMFRARWKNEPT